MAFSQTIAFSQKECYYITMLRETCDKTKTKTKIKTKSKFMNMRTNMWLALLGSILLAFSCAPISGVGGSGNSSIPTAPAAATDIDIAEADSDFFEVQWVAPVEMGTKSDGTVLTSEEIGYQIYYLVGTADQEVPSAESIMQNPDTQTREVTGLTSTTITGLEPDTRYFVVVASYNSFEPQLKTTSDKVIEVIARNDSSAPEAVTGIVVDDASIDSTSFVVQWTAPAETETGTKLDGTALNLEEIGYRIYYLVGAEDQYFAGAEDQYLVETVDQYLVEAVDQEVPSAESIRQNPDAQTQEVTGFTSTRIVGLEPATRYFVTVVSYNSFVKRLETASDEMVEARTGAATESFTGILSYEQEEYELGSGRVTTITPTDTPTIPSTAPSSATIRYTLERRDGTKLIPAPAIAEDGVITIDSTTTVGTARYLVRVEALGYTTQNVILTITIKNASFEGSLSYPETAHEFTMGEEGTIAPDSTPAISSADSIDPNLAATADNLASTATIRYSLTRSSGTEFDTEPSIADDSGIITVNPINIAGTARYTVRAEADGYTAQNATITITITEKASVELLRVSTYYSKATDVLPVELGQAIADDGTFSMVDETAILTATGLLDGKYTIHFGAVISGGTDNYSGSGDYSGTDNYSSKANDYSGGSYQKTATDSVLAILKSELTTNFFSFADGVVIGISGPGITDTQHLATYFPSNIYSHQDLQAMRKNLVQNYVLKNNIVFTSTSTSNYEAVGNANDPFAGSLDGAGYSITGIEIEGTDNYQGLFGVMKADTVDTVIAQNLVLSDFRIAGNAIVGSLAGWIKRGTVDRVSVEVSSPDAGTVEVSGSIVININDHGYGGGLLGYGGSLTGATDIQVKIQNTSSAAAVSGTGASSNIIGGLVGYMHSDAILTKSYTTGSVISTGNYAGGLVGWNKGTVTGYGTGIVTGIDFVGGLIGWNEGNMTGYAAGVVIGNNFGGGLVGLNSDGFVTGYARGTVRRRDGNLNTSFGKVIGIETGTNTPIVYSSMSENKIYDGLTGTTVLTNTLGNDGIGVNVADSKLARSREVFSRFSFGFEPGEWTWVADYMWPAINIGGFRSADEQPVDPCIFALSLDQCLMISELGAITYHSEVTDELPVFFGQAIADNDTFSMEQDVVILTVPELMDGKHTIHFGLVANGRAANHSANYSTSYQKTSINGVITILKSDLAANSFAFIDGAAIGMSGPSFRDTQLVAMYRPSNIYNHQDLQAIRKDLTRDYIVQKNIVFTARRLGTGVAASNYETVGSSNNPFTGSLNGAGNTIAGVEVISSAYYRGLFGVMEGKSSDTVIARNLVLRDFKISGNAYVGSLAGWVKRGMVDGIRVVGTGGKVEMKGSFGDNILGAGGLVGSIEGGVSVLSSSSAVEVIGSATSLKVGGLVGEVKVAATVVGYATGNVMSKGGSVGGLVGASDRGTVIGYATGNVAGSTDSGGLVGWSSGTGGDSGIVVGYATGNVLRGGHSLGGLLGESVGARTVGYARGVVRRGVVGARVSLGKTIGVSSASDNSQARATTYNSASESFLYDGNTGTTVLTGTVGVDGTPVIVDSTTERAAFSGFVFGTAVGKWTWVEDGKWPAINIGDFKPAAEQPVDP